MKPDQLERLQAVASTIAEVFIVEADPANWSGHNQGLAEMDAETRGARYWDKKNAIQTGTLLARVLDLSRYDQNAGKGNAMKEDTAEKEIKQFEARAKKLIDDIQRQPRH